MRPTKHGARSGVSAEASIAIGVIGLGIMGGVYARHLLEAGFSVAGYDIAPQRLHTFGMAGGHVCASAAEAVEASKIIIVALGSTSAFRSVMLDEDDGACRISEGQLFVETGTLPLELKEQARVRIESQGRSEEH